MTIIAIVSQKGGSGKTTLSVNLAAAAEAAGAVALIIDTDPQATASQWGAWRSDKAPEVIDSAPPRIQACQSASKRDPLSACKRGPSGGVALALMPGADFALALA